MPFPISKMKNVLKDTEGMDNWDKTFKKHELTFENFVYEFGQEIHELFEFDKANPSYDNLLRDVNILVIQKYPIENGMEKEIDYLYIKMPVFMTDREVVQEKRVWSEYNGDPKHMLIAQRSTTNSKYPVKEKPIRAEMILGGMYLKEVSPNETFMILINYFDLKITTGKDIVDKKVPSSAKEFFNNLKKYLEQN